MEGEEKDNRGKPQSSFSHLHFNHFVRVSLDPEERKATGVNVERRWGRRRECGRLERRWDSGEGGGTQAMRREGAGRMWEARSRQREAGWAGRGWDGGSMAGWLLPPGPPLRGGGMAAMAILPSPFLCRGSEASPAGKE